jgi:hypothetical protein
LAQELALLAHLEHSGTLAQAILVVSINNIHPGGFTRIGMSQQVNASSLETVRRRLSSHWNKQFFSISTVPAAEIKINAGWRIVG